MHAFHGHALFMLGRYAEAITPLTESIRRAPHVMFAHAWLAATLVALGRTEEAVAIAQDISIRAPTMNATQWRALALYRNSGDVERLTKALTAAGLE